MDHTAYVSESFRGEFLSLAKKLEADIVGFAPKERFAAEDPIFKIFPGTQTVIGLGFRVLRGIYRGVKEGTTYYQYTTMGVENMEETIEPMAALRLSMLLEANGYLAIPQRRHQQIMAEENSTNPEVDHNAVYRGRKAETQIDYLGTAVKCGLGEEGFSGVLLTDDFGPMVRWCFILTDAKFPETPEYESHLCDRCGKCAGSCPGHAIDPESGERDPWQCAVYYNGANGTKNPFMPGDAFADFEDRIAIIAGEAKVTPERAREILNEIIFYPPAKHSYPCSICGRACDMACYRHLEEGGKLTKSFKTPFHKRDDWQFGIEDFETKK